MKTTIRTEVHSFDCADGLTAVNENADYSIKLRYFSNTESYRNDMPDAEIEITHELIAEILRVFPCPEL
jgi:hypothetical protein